MKNDPYNDHPKCHKAKMINANGQASALCYSKPRVIPKTERYTLFANVGVTCRKCLAIIAAEAKTV